jgi:hypothetical protein
VTPRPGAVGGRRAGMEGRSDRGMKKHEKDEATGQSWTVTCWSHPFLTKRKCFYPIYKAYV